MGERRQAVTMKVTQELLEWLDRMASELSPSATPSGIARDILDEVRKGFLAGDTELVPRFLHHLMTQQPRLGSIGLLEAQPRKMRVKRAG